MTPNHCRMFWFQFWSMIQRHLIPIGLVLGSYDSLGELLTKKALCIRLLICLVKAAGRSRSEHVWDPGTNNANLYVATSTVCLCYP